MTHVPLLQLLPLLLLLHVVATTLQLRRDAPLFTHSYELLADDAAADDPSLDDATTHASLPFDALDVVARYAHSPRAFTEGLAATRIDWARVCGGGDPSSAKTNTAAALQLLESTGIWGASRVRFSSLNRSTTTSTPEQPELHLPPSVFGEGIALLHELDAVVQLTYRDRVGFVHPLRAWCPQAGGASQVRESRGLRQSRRSRLWSYPPHVTEGWGVASLLLRPLAVTTSATATATASAYRRRLQRFVVVSNGTSVLHWFRADDMSFVQSTEVTLPQESPRTLSPRTPLSVALNELEMVGDELWANWYGSRCILRINVSQPSEPRVAGVVRLPAMSDGGGDDDEDDYGMRVMNGIAWDPVDDRLFVTGKLWSTTFEVKWRANDRDGSVSIRRTTIPATPSALFAACTPIDMSRVPDSTWSTILSIVNGER